MERKRDKYRNIERFLIIISKIIIIFPFRIRVKLYEHFRKTKGNKGLAIRYVLIRTLVNKCGKNVSIQPDVYIFNPQNLSLGNNVSIHPMTYIECGKNGKIHIGDDVSIAHGVTILAENHIYSALDIPIKDQGLIENETIIENNVWIGAKATILSGRKVAKGCVIGANCVVTKDTIENTVVAGNPGKIIKERK